MSTSKSLADVLGDSGAESANPIAATKSFRSSPPCLWVTMCHAGMWLLAFACRVLGHRFEVGGSYGTCTRCKERRRWPDWIAEAWAGQYHRVTCQC